MKKSTKIKFRTGKPLDQHSQQWSELSKVQADWPKIATPVSRLTLNPGSAMAWLIGTGEGGIDSDIDIPLLTNEL